MTERMTDQAHWIEANGADDPETAELIQATVGMSGVCGSITIYRTGQGKSVISPVSTLVLPDVEAEMVFVTLLETYCGDS